MVLELMFVCKWSGSLWGLCQTTQTQEEEINGRNKQCCKV